MEMKVVKFGGSSLADANQFRRVAAIVKADPARRYVVASAPGKRHKEDVKVTDMLYHCYELVRQGKNISEYYALICERYNSIIADLGLDFDISGELDYIRNAIEHYSGQDFAASRGEYLNSLILAKYLKFDFIDAESVIYFRENGTFDEVVSFVAERKGNYCNGKFAHLFCNLCNNRGRSGSGATAHTGSDEDHFCISLQ